MKNSKVILKKVIVGILTLALLLSVGMVSIPTMAQSALADNDGFYVPYANTDLFTKYTDADPNKPGVNTKFDENGDRIGVHLTYNGGDFTKRVVSSAKYNIDDFSVRFDNLKKAEGHEDEVLKFTVMFGASDETMPALRILFDTDAGTMSYFSGAAAFQTPVLLTSSDLLKYEALSANEFIVSFDITSSEIICSVKVGENEAVEGYISAQSYMTDIPVNISSYLVLGPGKDGDYYFSYDVTGIKANNYTRPTNAILVGGITNLNGQGLNIIIENYLNKFPQARKLDFTTTNDIGNRVTSATTFPIDGFSAKFDSLTTKGTRYPEFTVAFDDNATDGNLPRLRVAIDSVTGNVKYWRGGEANIPVLGQSDLLKYENLSQSEFTVTFNMFNDADGVLLCKVTIQVDGTDAVVGTLPNSYLTNDYKNITADSAFYLCLGSGTQKDRDPYTVRFTGVRQTKELSFVDGETTNIATVTAGQTGIVLPKIELGEKECHAYWLNADKKYFAGTNESVYTASADTVFTAVRREYGDVNDDGDIDVEDIAMLRKYLLGINDSYLVQAANVDDDNDITILDLVKLKKYTVGLNVDLGPAR